MSAFFRTLRSRPDVVPLVCIVCFGASFGTYCLIRSSTVYTDVSWRHKANPHPWEHVKPTQQTKLMHAYDYSKLKDERPKF